jgi:hypothetical protein
MKRRTHLAGIDPVEVLDAAKGLNRYELRLAPIELEGDGAEALVLLARIGLSVVEDVAGRINYSSMPPLTVHNAVLELLLATPALKRALGGWFHGMSGVLQCEVDEFATAFRKFEKSGWTVKRILDEAERCNPKWKLDARGRLVFATYNPATGKREIIDDAGWTKFGLPPRRK